MMLNKTYLFDGCVDALYPDCVGFLAVRVQDTAV